MSNLYAEYVKYTKEYQLKYGPRTIVLYRCGSFFEIYSADNNLINIKEIGELLNIQVTRRDKSKLDVNESNFSMAGFPMNALKKFVNILVDNHYTVVVVDQVSASPKPKREVTDIISAGTRSDDIKTFEANNLMVVYLDEFEMWKSTTRAVSIGVSVIDLSTGKSKITECHSTTHDNMFALNELFKLIMFYQPKELVLTSTTKLNLDFTKLLDLQHIYVHDLIGAFPKEMLKVKYQEQVLKKVYKKTGLLSVFEYLEIERHPLATLSFVYLLQFCHQHNSTNLTGILEPDHVPESGCVIAYNSAKQLNLDALCGILNMCQTSMGKRHFRERLVQPETNIQLINAKYDMVEKVMPVVKELSEQLVNVYDLERLTKRLAMNKIQPTNVLQILNTLDAAINMSKHIGGDIGVDKIQELSIDIKSKFNTDELSKHCIEDVGAVSIFIAGVYLKLDKANEKYKYHYNKLQELALKVRKDGAVKVEHNDRDGYYFLITKKRFKEVVDTTLEFEYNDTCHSIKLSKFEQKAVSGSSSNLKLFHEVISEIEINIIKCQKKLVNLVTDQFNAILAAYHISYSEILQKVGNYIIDVDWYVSCAKSATQFRYVRPTISDKYTGRSYMCAGDLRHPVIERILDQEFVPNDVELGTDNIQGMLLYGVNSSGKSSISKAAALCIIMAQSGMFTPCSCLQYYPYRQIFTRIPSGDDMMKGQSTFVVEISELRNILRRADQNSLVIGDELASGTESISALAIVSSGVLYLAEQQSSFIFATHLHDVCQVRSIKSLESVKIYHLSIEYDGDKLIYNRKLKEGPGDTVYGLEVCKSLGLPKKFMNQANQIRNEAIGVNDNIMSTKKSRYNSKLYVDECGICGSSAQEVHHIKHQAAADKSGFINHTHKNKLGNLVGLCNKCHDDIHRNAITVEGYKQTSDGIELVVK